MENHFNCIYCYTNTVNGKKYVGQAVDFNRRFYTHLNSSYNENRRTYNVPFHCAIRKYGIENFEIEILEENLKKEELGYYEQYYIYELNTLCKNGKGYNIALGGNGGNLLAGKTEEEKEEWKEKLRKASKKTWENFSDEEKEEIIKKRLDTIKNRTDEEKEEISKKRREISKKMWEGLSKEERIELCKKISESYQCLSEEEKAERSKKMKDGHRNRTEEEKEEWKRKLSKIQSEIQKNRTEEEKKEIGKKISEQMKGEKNHFYGKHHTEETKEKISKTWENKSDEEKAERSRKISEAMNSKSDEEKKERSERLRKASEKMWENKSDEEKEEMKRKFKETMKNKSDEELAEIRRKQSETWNNKTDEEKEEYSRKMSKLNSGANNGRAKKVIQKDLNGDIIKIWDYAKQITKELDKINYGTLKKTLQGKRKTHEYNGFLWYYLDEYEQLTK